MSLSHFLAGSVLFSLIGGLLAGIGGRIIAIWKERQTSFGIPNEIGYDLLEKKERDMEGK